MSELKLSRSKFGKGITFDAGKWKARILLNGKRVFLGYFDSMKEAEDAYEVAKNAKADTNLNFLRS